MFDRKKGEDLEQLREESRLELKRERKKLEQEHEALEAEKRRMKRLPEAEIVLAGRSGASPVRGGGGFRPRRSRRARARASRA